MVGQGSPVQGYKGLAGGVVARGRPATSTTLVRPWGYNAHAATDETKNTAKAFCLALG